MSHVERGAKIVNQPDLTKKDWTMAHIFVLYNASKHLFMFHSLRVGKKRDLLQHFVQTEREAYGIGTGLKVQNLTNQYILILSKTENF